MTASTSMPIGKLSAATGVSVSALRHYDELGLVTSLERVGGKRRFGEDAVDRVRFVRRAQHVGFSLIEIRKMLIGPSTARRQLVDEQIGALRSRRIELDTMIASLEDLRSCDCRAIADCVAMT